MNLVCFHTGFTRWISPVTPLHRRQKYLLHNQTNGFFCLIMHFLIYRWGANIGLGCSRKWQVETYPLREWHNIDITWHWCISRSFLLLLSKALARRLPHEMLWCISGTLLWTVAVCDRSFLVSFHSPLCLLRDEKPIYRTTGLYIFIL